MKPETGRISHPRRKMVRMSSVDKNMLCSTRYSISEDEPLPEVPDYGARIQVCYAGACSPDVKSTKNKVRNSGFMDTSLFPGYEVSGVVDGLGPLANTNLKVGDRVVLYPGEDIGFEEGYSQFVIVNDLDNICPIPHNLSLEVAALLPTGGLTAYSACLRAKPYMKQCITEHGQCNVLVVGAGGLGLWATIMATHLSADPGTCSRDIKVIVADTNSEKLVTAQDHGCYGVIHWPKDAYEEHIIERTRNTCPTGIDVVIDFVSSPRTIERGLHVLNKGGIMVVGGNSQHVVQINLSDLARKEQMVIAVRKGTRDQLKRLIELVASGQVSTPHFDTFQLQDADEVFQGLSDCKIKGRAVLQVSATSI